mmetsp:Transcript_36482/g.76169  ORF Transcript_36482/g.76169 Transcript_36482/m.76169 type:complete len:224 (-) Transcript_36482:444-1115(-)
MAGENHERWLLSGGRTSRSERGPELRVGGCAQDEGLLAGEARFEEPPGRQRLPFRVQPACWFWSHLHLLQPYMLPEHEAALPDIWGLHSRGPGLRSGEQEHEEGERRQRHLDCVVWREAGVGTHGRSRRLGASKPRLWPRPGSFAELLGAGREVEIHGGVPQRNLLSGSWPKLYLLVLPLAALGKGTPAGGQGDVLHSFQHLQTGVGGALWRRVLRGVRCHGR